MSKLIPRRQFLATAVPSVVGLILVSRASAHSLNAAVIGRGASLSDMTLLADVKRLEARFYHNVLSSHSASGALAGARLADPMVARYVREVAADKAHHVALLAGSAKAPLRPVDLGPRPFTHLAQAIGLVPPGEAFDPHADDTSVLRAAYLLETACAGVHQAAARRSGTQPGPLTPVIADAHYHAGLIRTALAAHGRLEPDRQAALDRLPAALDRVAGGVPAQGRSLRQAARMLLLGEGRRGGFFPAGLAPA